MKHTTSPIQSLSTKQIGDLGEAVAVQYLTKEGYEIIEQNYWRKWGELDVICKRNNVVHFVEVKTVSHETVEHLKQAVYDRAWRPEERVHAGKLKRMQRAISTWLAEKSFQGEWQIDVLAVRIVPRETFATVNLIEKISFD